MRCFIGLGVVFLLSCHNGKTVENKKSNSAFTKRNIDSFDIFLHKFALKTPPISFDKKLLNNFSYENVDLDTLLVSRFVEKDKIIIGDLSIYSSTKFYPLYKFKVDSLWGVIVMYSSGSGAVDDKYHLILYDNSGIIKSNLTVGKQVGSCESLETQIFSISTDYIVSTKLNQYIGNCANGNMKLVKTQDLNYQIGKSGSIAPLN